MKGTIIQIYITARLFFFFSCFLALKIAVSAVIFCSFNDVLSDLDFKLTGLTFQACGRFANEKDPTSIVRDLLN